jgi:hypothetical protein
VADLVLPRWDSADRLPSNCSIGKGDRQEMPEIDYTCLVSSVCFSAVIDWLSLGCQIGKGRKAVEVAVRSGSPIQSTACLCIGRFESAGRFYMGNPGSCLVLW